MTLVAAGVPLPADRVFDGRDPTAALSVQATSPHAQLYSHWGKRDAIRLGCDKLVRNSPQEPWELYDLEADLGEMRNLADERPETVARLAKRYEEWWADVHRDVLSDGDTVRREGG